MIIDLGLVCKSRHLEMTEVLAAVLPLESDFSPTLGSTLLLVVILIKCNGY